MNKQYDVAVVGGGPGGYIAAIRCAQLGLKTALIEKREVGGTCLNRGCIPTKALLHSSEVYHTLKNAAEFGVVAENAGFDYAKMGERKNAIVSKLRGGIASLLKSAGITVLSGEGKLKDKHTIIVGGADEITAESIIIASGSLASSIPIQGIDLPGVINSDGVLSLTDCPEQIVIVGGGVIGIEFATLFNNLGRKVTVIELLKDILPGIDGEISSVMRKLLEKRGVVIHTGARMKQIEGGAPLRCLFEVDGAEKSVPCNICVIAAGRKPNTEALGLEAVGVQMQKGFLSVNEHMRTSVENIYAIGDCTGMIQLAHVASAQGLVAAHCIAGQTKRMEYNAVPSCIYTNPEIASVGLSEQEAMKRGYDVQIGRFFPSGNGKSLVIGEKDGLVKLITDKKTGEILGAHIMSARATDLISEICAVMKSEGTLEELSDTIHPHPTVSEMIMEAAHDAEGLCCHLPFRKPQH